MKLNNKNYKKRENLMKTIKIVLFSLALIAAFASSIEAGILHDLVKEDDFIGLQSLLNPELQKDLKININETDGNGDTPLIKACLQSKPNIKIIKLLIQKGAKVDLLNRSNETPLILACRPSTDIKIIIFLIQNGADVNVGGYTNWTVLQKACLTGCIGIVKLLIHHGAKIDLQDWLGETPLSLICKTEKPNVEIIKLLIQEGAKLVPHDACNDTPLTLECQKDNPNIEIIKLLTQAGADLNTIGCAKKRAINQISRWWTPEQRTELFNALATLKPNLDGNTKAFAGLALESMIERLQQNIVPPVLANDDKLYKGNKYITNPKELIQLLHARMNLFFGPKGKDIFPNHIPGDGLSLEMKKLDQQVFIETLQKLIEKRYYNSHRNMSPRKVNTFKILERFAQAFIKKYNSNHNLNNPKTYALAKSPYLKFRDIRIWCGEDRAY